MNSNTDQKSSFISNLLSSKYVVLLIFLSSVICLLTALFYDYVLGYVPCYLCIYERIPYIILIVACAYCLYISYSKIPVYVIYASILTAIAISAYHAGLELGIFSPSEHCKPVVNYQLPIEDLKLSLKPSKLGDCSVAAVKVFGLSMTEWNLILNIAFLCLLIIRKDKKAELAPRSFSG